MAKVYYPAWLEAVSGKVGNAVFCKSRVLPRKTGELPGGYLRRFAFTVSYSLLLVNLRNTFRIISHAWTDMTEDAKQNWNSQAKTLSLGYLITGRMYFFSYFLSKYHAVNTLYFKTVGLSSPLNPLFEDRNRRYFDADVI